MGSGKGGAPAAPNYWPLLAASQATAQSDAEAARLQSEVAQKQLAQQDIYAGRSADVADKYAGMAQNQLDWSRQQYDQMYPYLQKYMQGQVDFGSAALENQKVQTANAALAQKQSEETYNRYMTTYAPREDQFTKEAFEYASPARMDQAAAEAQGDVSTAYQARHDAMTRELQKYGVDPSQGAASRAQVEDITRAAALASSATQSRKQTEMQGKQMELAALQIGQKLPAQAIGQAGLGTQQATSGLAGATVGGGGLQAGTGLFNAGAGAMGSPTQYASMSNPYTQLAGAYGTQGIGAFGASNTALGNAGSVYGGMGTMLNNMYSNQMEGYKAQAAQSPWGAIGKIAGIGLPMAFGFPPMG